MRMNTMHAVAMQATGAGALFLSAAPVLAQAQTAPGYWNDEWGYGHMMFGGFWMILLWGGLLILAFMLVRWMAPHQTHPTSNMPKATALDILQERFARGEIDEAEYEARKRVLNKN